MSAITIPLVTIVLALGGSLLWGLVATVLQVAATISRQRAESNLKMEMIRRGYSADDIERICKIQVPAGTRADTADWAPVKAAPPKPAAATSGAARAW